MTTTAATVARSWRQRHGATLFVGGAFIIAVLVSIVLGAGNNGPTVDNDPDNAGPNGSRALARVLDQQGVDVSVVRSANDLEDTTVGPDTMVVVTSTDQLGQDTVDRLLEHTGENRVIIVDPGPAVLDALGTSTQFGISKPTKGLAAGCDDPTFAGLTFKADSAVTYVVPYDARSACFAAKNGEVVLLKQQKITLFGGGEAMTNDQILRGDNAAIGLRLLGQDDKLVWYVPRIEDVGAADRIGQPPLLPRWIQPGLWVVAIAAIFLIIWRARRLGPLSTEPLPAVVKAIETTRSRGRLYRKAKDRSHAAAVLRSAARDRAAHRLGLQVGHDQDALIVDVARQIGRPAAEVATLIGANADTPASDRDLIKLARDLTELDREVRNT